MEGLPANITRSDLCNPPNKSSNAKNPEEIPDNLPLFS